MKKEKTVKSDRKDREKERKLKTQINLQKHLKLRNLII